MCHYPKSRRCEVKEMKYKYIDVHWDEKERPEAMKRRKELLKQGYTLEAEDVGSDTDNCDQYHKYVK